MKYYLIQLPDLQPYFRTYQKAIFCFLLSFYSAILVAQTPLLSGRIIDCKYKTAIPKSTIKLVGSDGSIIQTESDSTGFYQFANDVLKRNTSYVIVTQSPVPPDAKRVPFGKCPYSMCHSGELGYMNSSEKVKFRINDSLPDKAAIHDFCLVENRGCGWTIPDIYFRQNSLLFGADKIKNSRYAFSPDTALDCLVDFMIGNPAFVVEIGGHADKTEKNAEELALLRADKVYSYFIKKGIAKERLILVGYGSRQPAKRWAEAEDVILSGAPCRRVSLMLLAKDYSPSSKDSNKNNAYKNLSEDSNK